MKQLPLAIRLRERAVFDVFVAGANQTAFEQLRALAAGTGRGAFWLAGAEGGGKTHLLQATCHAAASRGGAPAYLPLSELQPLGAEALEGWQDATLLAIDDLHLVAGDAMFERALFRLYRECDERRAALLLAAPAPPAQLPFKLPDLASRFAAATLLTLQALTEAEQREALQRRAHERGLELPDDAALYLQRHFRRDLPTLCGLLDTIDEASLQAQRRLTLPFIRQVLLNHAAASR